LVPKNIDEMLKKLCYYCERPNCSNFCNGFCRRSFHLKCIAKVEDGWVNIDGPEEDLKPEELLKDPMEVKKTMND
jgi:chromodomain-helicase-DNA-binding protein 7